MKTLLILGSKPKPTLPPRGSFQAVACANASGYSAEAHDLPRPVYTVMTPVIACDIEAGRQSLEALTGLSTGTVYLLRRRSEGRRGLARILHDLKTFRKKPFHRMQPFYLKRKLRTISYRHEHLLAIAPEEYDTLVEVLCDQDSRILAQLRRKRPSTGIIALALAIDREDYDRYILSGFDFELTHSYATNPMIERRGTAASPHAPTDQMVIAHLARKMGNIFTTEKAVHERADVPFLPR